jgi:hypothetical protein
MWQILGLFCLPLPLLLLFLAYKQLLERSETRTLISRLRSAGHGGSVALQIPQLTTG